MGSLLNCQSCSVLQALNTLLFYIKAGRQVCWILLPFYVGGWRRDGGREAVKEQERKGGVNRPIRRPAWGSGTWLHMLQRAATTGIIMQHNAGAWPYTFDAFMCLWVRLNCILRLISLTFEFTRVTVTRVLQKHHIIYVTTLFITCSTLDSDAFLTVEVTFLQGLPAVILLFYILSLVARCSYCFYKLHTLKYIFIVKPAAIQQLKVILKIGWYFKIEGKLAIWHEQYSNIDIAYLDKAGNPGCCSKHIM